MTNLPTTLIRLQKTDGTYVFISHIQSESGRFFPKEETRENPSLETYQLSVIVPPIAYPLFLAHFVLAHVYQNLRAGLYRRKMLVDVTHSDVGAQFEDFCNTLEEILETFCFNLNPQQGQGTGPFINLEGEISQWLPDVGKTSGFIAKFQQIFPNTGTYTDTVHVSEALAHLFDRVTETFHLRTDMETWDELSQLKFMQLKNIQEIHEYLRKCLGEDGAETTIDKLTDALSGDPKIPDLHYKNGFELLEHLVDRAARVHGHTERHEMQLPFWKAVSRAARKTNTPMHTIEDISNLDREWAMKNREVSYTLGQDLLDLRNTDRQAFEIPYRSIVTLKPEVQRNFQQVIFQPHYKDPSLGLREHGVYWFPSALVIPWLTLGVGVGMLNALGIPILHFGREQGAPGRPRYPVRARYRAGQGNRQIHPFTFWVDTLFDHIYERFIQFSGQLGQISGQLGQISGQVGQTGNQVRENIERRQGLLTNLLTKVLWGGLLFVFGQNPSFYAFIVSQFGRFIGAGNRGRLIGALKAFVKYLVKYL